MLMESDLGIVIKEDLVQQIAEISVSNLSFFHSQVIILIDDTSHREAIKYLFGHRKGTSIGITFVQYTGYQERSSWDRRIQN